jgi:hypothetical protein
MTNAPLMTVPSVAPRSCGQSMAGCDQGVHGVAAAAEGLTSYASTL